MVVEGGRGGGEAGGGGGGGGRGAVHPADLENFIIIIIIISIQLRSEVTIIAGPSSVSKS